MATQPPTPIESLSSILDETLQGDPEVTVGELADRVARRGFGVFMIVLALPTMIPILPPGSAATIGLLYVILSVQMLIGWERPWLPPGVRHYRLSPSLLESLHRRGIPFLRRVERFSRPRPILLDERIIARIVAVAVFLLGVVLFSPLPFFNTIPALTVLVLGVGLLNRDGVFILAGMLMAAVVLSVVAFSAGTLYALAHWLVERLSGR